MLSKKANSKDVFRNWYWYHPPSLKFHACLLKLHCSPVDLYLISEKSIWKDQVWRTGFLVYLLHKKLWLISMGTKQKENKNGQLNFPNSQNFLIASLYFLKWCPIFDASSLHQLSKFNNFLLVGCFVGKNLSNFVPPA